MGLLDPRLPDHALDEWVGLPFTERLRMQCVTWTSQGFGAPPAVYAFYLVKAGLFVLGWLLFAGSTEGFGGPWNVANWWTELAAFQKAVLWAMLFEGLGLGCGSGPLTGRYMPPFVAFTHFLRPGTTRLPPWPDRNPLALGTRRTILDALLYLALVVALVAGLLSNATVPAWHLAAILALLGVLALRDKTLLLVFRSEHYALTLLVLALAGSANEAIAGAKLVQLAIWWGAATSKLNHHFPSVVAVMVSNAPLIPNAVKQRMYVAAPDDLRPSGLAKAMAHGGTVVEYAFPLVLVLSDGGVATNVALAVMLAFHLFIMTSVALGVPNEWNVFFLYSMFFLFGSNASVGVTELTDPVIVLALVALLVVVPVVGNLRPDLVSFLPAMRYYAGNWATSQWLFRKGTLERLDEHVTKTSKTTRGQLGIFYDDVTVEYVFGKVPTFRAMHLHGRLFASLAPRAVPDLEAVDVVDGELVAGLVLGWNFGDGHLHDEQLLAAVQEQVGFAPGELVAVMVEGQPMGKPWWAWRIVDAATGELEHGRAEVAPFLDRQPWEAVTTPEALGVGQ